MVPLANVFIVPTGTAIFYGTIMGRMLGSVTFNVSVCRSGRRGSGLIGLDLSTEAVFISNIVDLQLDQTVTAIGAIWLKIFEFLVIPTRKVSSLTLPTWLLSARL